MKRVVLITVLAYAVLYAPQPLLPLLAGRFELSQPTAGLLIGAVMLPLSFAPLSYGYLLQRGSAAVLLRRSVLVLGATQLAFGVADSFGLMLGLRVAQGLVLPAVLTALMTMIAATSPGGRLRRRMSVYVAASIMGGFLGRLLAGLGAELVGWRAFLLLLGAGLLAAGLPRIDDAGTQAGMESPDPRQILQILSAPAYRRLYAMAFSFFFVFAGLLNYLPFRLLELHGSYSSLLSGLVYTGFLLGVATALGSTRIAAALGGEVRALRVGFAAYAGALLLALVPSVPALFATVFVFCGAMFFLHATAAGLVNQQGRAREGLVNGLYLASYYAGGVLGSYLPGFAYERLGWPAVIAVLAVVLLGGLLAAWRAALPVNRAAAA